MIEQIGLIGFGFGLGVLCAAILFQSREKDLLDRLSWRNPEDYFFMKWQRDNAQKKKPGFKMPSLGLLKKKDVAPVGVPIDKTKVEQQIEHSIAAKEENVKNYNEYHDSVSQMAKAGISNP